MLTTSALTMLAFLLVAAIGDVRTRRIPNVLTLPMMGAGLGLAFLEGGLPSCAWSFAGLLAGGALLLPLFVLGGMGAGDVKLFAGVGAFLGPAGVLIAFVAVAVLGAVLAILLLLVRRRGLSAVTRQAEGVWLTWLTRRNHLFFGTENLNDPIRLPYAIPIGLGTLLVLATGLARA